MSKKLENKVAVIKGATGGMALATAKLFVEEGAYVFSQGVGKMNLTKRSLPSAKTWLALNAIQVFFLTLSASMKW